MGIDGIFHQRYVDIRINNYSQHPRGTLWEFNMAIEHGHL